MTSLCDFAIVLLFADCDDLIVRFGYFTPTCGLQGPYYVIFYIIFLLAD
jgi:hypothetical protein